MKQTIQPEGEQRQKAAAGQMRTRAAQRKTASPEGRLTQLAAMVHASPQTEMLMQLNGMVQQGSPVQRLMALTGEINSCSPAQLSGIPVKNDAALQPVGQKVVQRELYESGDFTEPEPEVTEDYETLKQNDTWHFLQQGLKMFTSAAGGILRDIENLPNLVLTLSTSTEIDSIGLTTLKLVDPEGKVHTSESGKHNSATVQQWSRWLGNPKTRAAALVQINPNQISNAAEVAHTLNHEVFLHAVEILDEIKSLKSIKDDKTREEFALQHVRNPDKDHHDFVFGLRRDLLALHSRMLSQALSENPARAQDLMVDYKKDWSLRREDMLKHLAGKLWDGNEESLKKSAEGVIREYGSSSEPGAQAEVKAMREIVRIIDYSFELHVADVRERYEIDLSPRIEEPKPKAGKVVDLSALPTGPGKKGK